MVPIVVMLFLLFSVQASACDAVNIYGEINSKELARCLERLEKENHILNMEVSNLEAKIDRSMREQELLRGEIYNLRLRLQDKAKKR
jgi:predicted RNase H-like nuclease (RuvC/YqgF family)